MSIKTFRGQIADNEIVKINLKTKQGKVGYRITKFQVMAVDPMSNSQESVVKIFSEEFNITATEKINFSDMNLLAAAYLENDSSGATPMFINVSIFDHVIFNQDIIITHVEQGSDACNYYIELEQVKLNENETTMATLQSIRSSYESYTRAGPT